MLIQVRCKKCVFFHLRSHAMCRLITMFVLVVPEPRILFGTKTKRLLTRIVVVTLQCRFAEDGLETSLYVPFVLRRSYHPPSAFAFLVASARHGASLPILLSLHARLPSSCAVYVHAHGFFRPCNANATHLVAQTTTCPTTAPRGVHLENHGATASTPLENAVHLLRPRSKGQVQLLSQRPGAGATAKRRGKEGCNCTVDVGHAASDAAHDANTRLLRFQHAWNGDQIQPNDVQHHQATRLGAAAFQVRAKEEFGARPSTTWTRLRCGGRRCTSDAAICAREKAEKEA